jgi:hypothetical protein
LGLTPRLCYSGPPGARSARGLSFVFLLSVRSSRLASRPTSTRPSCARLTRPVVVFRAFPAQALPASPSCPLLWLSWRVGLPSRPLSLASFCLERPAGPRQQQPSCSGCPPSFSRGNRRGACLLASSTNDYGTRTSANLSSFQALSVFNRRACEITKPTRSKPSSRRHHPARRAAVTAHSRQPLILYFSRRQRRRFEGARARKLSHNARPSPALSTPETPHGGSLRLSPEPIFGSLSRKGLQAEGPSRDGASAPTLTQREPCWRRGTQALGQPWGWSR